MANNLILTALISSNFDPNRIECKDFKDNLICTIYCDYRVSFDNKLLISHEELTQIKTITENFNLFFANITKG